MFGLNFYSELLVYGKKNLFFLFFKQKKTFYFLAAGRFFSACFPRYPAMPSFRPLLFAPPSHSFVLGRGPLKPTAQHHQSPKDSVAQEEKCKAMQPGLFLSKKKRSSPAFWWPRVTQRRETPATSSSHHHFRSPPHSSNFQVEEIENTSSCLHICFSRT